MIPLLLFFLLEKTLKSQTFVKWTHASRLTVRIIVPVIK